MTGQVFLALSTCPDDAVAQHIAETLVREQLAACVNRVPGVRSTYLWEGQLQDDAEVLLIIKSTIERLSQVERRLKELHPYELPEFVTLPVTGGNDAYLDWIRRNVGSRGNQ